MPIDTRGLALAEELGTDVRSLRLDVGDLSALTTVEQDNLVEALNELQAEINAVGGGSSDLEGLSDVDLTSPVENDILRRNGAGQFVNVTKSAFLGSNLTALDVASTAYGRGLLNTADQAALRTTIGAASETVLGLAELATTAEALAGVSGSVVTTPVGVKAVVDAAITALLNGTPPTTLDTITEIATAIQDADTALDGLITTVSGKQAGHANLTAFSGLSLVADRLPYANGTGTLALATFTAAGRALLDDADAAAQRTTLDVYSKTEIGNPETDFLAAYIAARDA